LELLETGEAADYDEKRDDPMRTLHTLVGPFWGIRRLFD
jgi:hypothetical protein